jgi:hypothetical protein
VLAVLRTNLSLGWHVSEHIHLHPPQQKWAKDLVQLGHNARLLLVIDDIVHL